MIGRLRKTTLRTKVVLIATTASTVGFVIAGFGLLQLDMRQIREAMREESTLVATTLAHDARSSLLFEDRESAREVLEALRKHPDLRRAQITDAEGRVFASLEGSAATGDERNLRVSVPVALDSRRIGTVTLETGLARLKKRQMAYFSGLIVAILAGLLASMLAAVPLQRIVGRPLLELASNAERVRQHRGPGRVVPRFSDDELGRLTDSVNRMLGDLHQRETDLRAAKRNAVEEARAAARQAEATERANRELRSEMQKRRELQQQLERSQRIELLGQMAGGVAHDVNNALTVILGWADLGRGAVDDPDAVRQALDHVDEAARQASKTTGQLLAFARNQLARPEPLDLNDLALRVQELADRIAGEDVTMVCRLAEDVQPAMADPGQLEQVLMNLVVNARDAVSDGGTITLRTACEAPTTGDRDAFEVDPAAEFTMIAVEDDGPGIPPEIEPRLFEPFFTTKEIGRGTGLGLAVCYRIVRSHGGVITVASRPGVGSSFRVYLPRAPSPVVRTEPEVWKPGQTGRQSRILVVEDEDTLRSLIGNVLRSAGHEVAEASNGTDALSVLDERGSTFELVISDVRMPQLGGAQLERTVRERFPDLPVLLISGYHEEQLRRDHEDVQVRFLPKPFRPAELLDEVRTILNRA